MSISRSLLITGTLLVCTGYSHAAITGMDLDPLGNRNSAGVEFAVWDLFSRTPVNPPVADTYDFAGIADPTSTLTDLSLVQLNSHISGTGLGQGAGLLSGGDVYYSSTFAQNWVLTGKASIDITTISFQIKTANVETVIEQLYLPTLTGSGPASYHTSVKVGTEKISGFDAYAIEYRWEGLEIPANTPLEITFGTSGTGLFARKPIDFVSIDVATVPEPSTGLLCGAAALLLPNLRRRRRMA